MKKLYICPPDNEIALENQLINELGVFNERLPTQRELIDLGKKYSMTYSTMMLYLSIKKLNANFINMINKSSIDRTPLGEVKVGLVPAMFHEHYPEVGGDGAHLINVAKDLGIDIEQVPSKSGGGVIENAEILARWIRSQTKQKIWLLTMSRGSLDFRYAHQHLLTKEEIKKIHYWLNFTGFPHGNILAELSFQNWKMRLKTRLTCLVTGLSFDGVNEMRKGHTLWQNDFKLDPNIKAFNFVPIPLPSHVQTSLVNRYQWLSAYGPNDGMALCLDAIYENSPIYPLFGLDHFCRSPRVSQIVYQIFSYMKQLDKEQTQPKSIETNTKFI